MGEEDSVCEHPMAAVLQLLETASGKTEAHTPGPTGPAHCFRFWKFDWPEPMKNLKDSIRLVSRTPSEHPEPPFKNPLKARRLRYDCGASRICDLTLSPAIAREGD
jgi:hypothetical protein